MKQYISMILSAIEAHSEDFANAGVTPPQTVDVYMGQPSKPEDFEFSLPAVFVDYAADYDGEVFDLYLHVLQDFADDTENFAPNREQGLEYLTFLTVLKRILNGIKMKPVFGVLRPYQESPVLTEFYQYHMLAFRCSFDAEASMQTERYVNVEPVFPKIENTLLKEKW